MKVSVKRCKRSHIPNTETVKAMQDAERGENLIEFKSIEDFFKSMKE